MTPPKLDPHLQAQAAKRASRLRAEAEHLRRQAAMVEARAAVIERTWQLDAPRREA